MTQKEIKEYVLLLMCKSVIAKLTPEVSAKFRKELKEMKEGLDVFRPKGDVSEAVAFASIMAETFTQLAKTLSDAQNLETVGQVLTYLKSLQEGAVAVVETGTEGYLLHYPIKEDTPWPSGEGVYAYSNKNKIWIDVDSEAVWDVVRTMGTYTHWTRMPAPSL